MRSSIFLTILSSCFFVRTALAQDGGGDSVDKLKTAHAALASVAWVFFFPLGSILLRFMQGTKSTWIHVGIQLFATAIFTAAVGLGITVALDQGEISEYHCIIGLVLFSVLFIQAVGGFLHHLGFRKRGKRTVVSYVHIWLGRALITLGMINGGLGLLLASDAENGDYIAYGVVAGFIWVVWMAVDVRASVMKRKQPQIEMKKEEGLNQSSY